MKLLPYEIFTVETREPLPSVVDRLAAQIEAPRIRWGFSRDHKPYQGTISETGFEIRRIIHYRNSFLPKIRGQFEATPQGTLVRIKMGLYPFVTAFLLFWFFSWYSFVIPLFLSSGALFGEEFVPWLPVVLPLVVLFAFWWAFWCEARRSRRELTAILLGQSFEQETFRTKQPRLLWIVTIGAVVFWNIVIFNWFFSPAGQDGSQSVGGKFCDQSEIASPYCDFAVMHTLEGHPKASTIAVSHDGKTLVSGGSDKAIKVWDVQTGQLKRTLQSDSGTIAALAIAPDNKTIVSGSGDRMVRIWDLTSSRRPQMLQGHSSQSVSPVAISADGKTLVSGGYSELRLWDLANGKLKATFPEDSAQQTEFGPLSIGNSQRFRIFSLNPDGNIALVEAGSRLLVWDLATQQQTKLPGNWFSSTNAARISPDGKTVVTTTYLQPKTQLKIWDLATRKLKAKALLSSSREFWGYNDRIALSRDRIFTSAPRGLMIWNLQTGELEATLGGERMRHLLVSADGKRLIGITSNSPTYRSQIKILERP